MNAFRRTLRATATALVLALAPASALAVPSIGDSPSNARVEDTDGHALEVRDLVGKPALVLYEDRGSESQNTALKDGIKQLGHDARLRAGITFAVVADVSAYAHWPMKGFARKAIQKIAKAAGTPIYCDWDGAFRSALGLARGMSNVVLFDRTGRVLFSAAGPVTAKAREELFAMMSRQVE